MAASFDEIVIRLLVYEAWEFQSSASLHPTYQSAFATAYGHNERSHKFTEKT